MFDCISLQMVSKNRHPLRFGGKKVLYFAVLRKQKNGAVPPRTTVRDSGIFSQKHHLFCKAFNSIYGKCRYTFNHNRYLFHKIEHIRAEKGVPMDQTQAAPEAHITYYGGKWVAFAPILLAIVGLIYIAVKQADVPEYWVVFLLPMIVCLFLPRTRRPTASHYRGCHQQGGGNPDHGGSAGRNLRAAH